MPTHLNVHPCLLTKTIGRSDVFSPHEGLFIYSFSKVVEGGVALDKSPVHRRADILRQTTTLTFTLMANLE